LPRNLTFVADRARYARLPRKMSRPEPVSGPPSLDSPIAIAFISAHGVLWLFVIIFGLVRLKHFLSERRALAAKAAGNELANTLITRGRATVIKVARRTRCALIAEGTGSIRLRADLMTSFDLFLVLGATLICWAPVYLAGEPTPHLCSMRTSLLPIGLAAMASAQITKTFVVSKLIKYEWQVLSRTH